MHINTVNKGTAAEMLVAGDLMLRGFEVYHGLSGREQFDLVAVKGVSCLRIEVKANQLPTFGLIQNLCDLWAVADLESRQVTYEGEPLILAVLNQPGMRLQKAIRRVQDRSKIENKYDGLVLKSLGGAQRLSVYDMVANFGGQRSEVQRSVQRLIKKGLVHREKDHRMFRYSLVD